MSYHVPPHCIYCSRCHWPGECPMVKAPDWAINLANRIRAKLDILMNNLPFGRNGHV